VNYQLWMHKKSGETYVVEIAGNGKVFKANGPLHYSEEDAALDGDFDNDEDTRLWIEANQDDFNLVR
jgi:hypothetical protein